MRKRKQNAYLPFILLAVVLVITVVSLVIAGQVRQANIDDPGEFASQDDVPRLTAKEAYEAQMNGEAVIVDTRSAIQYDTLVILPGPSASPWINWNPGWPNWTPISWYITYCT